MKLDKRVVIFALLWVSFWFCVGAAFGAEGLHILKGRSYMLQDEFTDTKAAGALDDTSTFPGGWVRDVATDTNSKLTIASGLLTFATGGAAAGDPGIWYTVKTRTSGMGIIAEVTPAGVTDASIAVGWDSNQAGALSNYLSFAASGALQAVVNGGTAISVGTYTAASHKIALFQRATGYYAFIRFPTGFWKLVWIGGAGTNNLYPGVSSLGTAAVATVDYLRIPTQKYIPVPVAYDTFDNATVAQDLTTHGSNTTGPDSQSTPAVAWTGGANWTINGVAKNSPVGGEDVATNGNFSETTYTDSSVHAITGFTNVGTHNATNKITLADGTATFLSDGTLTGISVPSTPNVWYKIGINVISGTVSLKFFNELTSLIGGEMYSTGIKSYSGRSTLGSISLIRSGITNCVIDDVSFKPLTLSDLLITHTSSTPDVLQSVVVAGTPLGTQAGLALNWDAGRTYGIICYIDGSTAKCEQNRNGTWSALDTPVTGSITYNASYTLAVWKSGTAVRLYYNNALVAAGVANADFDTATAAANGRTNHGLFSTYSTNTFDGYTIFPVGTSNEHSTLDIIGQ